MCGHLVWLGEDVRSASWRRRCIQPSWMGRVCQVGREPNLEHRNQKHAHHWGTAVHLASAEGELRHGSRVGLGRCKDPECPKEQGLYPTGDQDLPGILSGRR